MHSFDDLVDRSTTFTLNALKELNLELRTSASTIAIKNLQAIQLQKAIMAIGMFSLFDSILQDGMACRNGFEEAKKVIRETGNNELHDRFDNFICAINVLKHGQGRSYDVFVAKSNSLPFRIKLPRENFFFEGDVSEVSTLIEVDGKFVLNCAELIEQVSKEIRKMRSDYFF